MKKIYKINFDKLVRDKIPDIIRNMDIEVYEKAIGKTEFIQALKNKLLEETQEVIEAKK